MQQPVRIALPRALQRWLVGAAGFAFVVTWATLGATTAVVAVVVGFAAMHHEQARPALGRWLALGRRARAGSGRGRRPRPAADDYQLVPDDPSLVVSVYSS